MVWSRYRSCKVAKDCSLTDMQSERKSLPSALFSILALRRDKKVERKVKNMSNVVIKV